MENQFFVALCYAICVFPYAVLCYLPFLNRLRLPKRLLIAATGVFGVLSCAVMSYASMHFVVWMHTVTVYSLAAFFIFYLCTVREDMHKLLFVFLLMVNYGAIVGGGAAVIENCIDPMRMENSPTVYTLIAQGIMLILTYPLVVHLVRKHVVWMLEHFYIKKIWGMLWVVPAMLSIVLITESRNSMYMNDQVLKGALVEGVVVTGTVVIYYMIYRMMRESVQRVELEENKRVSDRLLSIQREAYHKMMGQIVEIQRAQHDMRHHAVLINSYLQSGEEERLREYLLEYVKTMPRDSRIKLCENTAVDSILRYFMDATGQKGIRMKSNVELPEDVGIQDSDLCIIFGNCLENALEGCLRLEEGEKRFISALSSCRGNTLFLTVDNSSPPPATGRDGAFLSSKRQGVPGLGIMSVRTVAEKYGGSSRFEYVDGVFRVSIALQLPLDIPQEKGSIS